ncbi:virulence factor [Rhodovulum sp. DZ06]|uniref:virulence factor n=1 Tax=Rhodovulum sp. DZ06 TaxID=3425126 RepID=UPI003D34574C
MAKVQVIWWRDIPAQVIAGRGRKAAKAVLPERFEQAIDRCAMKVGAKDADAYLAEWRRSDPYEVEGADADAVAAEAGRLDEEYGPERLRALIEAEGWGPDRA